MKKLLLGLICLSVVSSGFARTIGNNTCEVNDSGVNTIIPKKESRYFLKVEDTDSSKLLKFCDEKACLSINEGQTMTADDAIKAKENVLKGQYINLFDGVGVGIIGAATTAGGVILIPTVKGAALIPVGLGLLGLARGSLKGFQDQNKLASLYQSISTSEECNVRKISIHEDLLMLFSASIAKSAGVIDFDTRVRDKLKSAYISDDIKPVKNSLLEALEIDGEYY